MNSQLFEYSVRHIGTTSPDFLRALHLAVGEDFDGTLPSSRTVSDLLAAAGRGSCSLDLVLGAFGRGGLENAVAALVFPGSASLVLFPSFRPDREALGTNVALLQALLQAAWERSLKLLQVLVSPEAQFDTRDLEAAGYRYLTQLVYLVRPNVPCGAVKRIRKDLSWISYAPEEEERFRRALELSYVESLDCPELTGLRSTAEVLAGHRATGIFDPSLWWVAMCSSVPVGIALLNRVPSQSALEIVYIGVSKEMRGTGVADALLERMVTAGRYRGVERLTLAVDCRNTRARRMYERWGFKELSVLDAWIATAPRA